jgi:adenylate cyclase
MSSLPANDFFTEGLVEELISGLARLNGVRVAARTSSKAFRTSELDAREIARRLNVTALLEGSLRQSDQRIRITVQLVDGADGCHLWSERYERQLADPFTLQDELTRLIVEGVEGRLTRLCDRDIPRPV